MMKAKLSATIAAAMLLCSCSVIGNNPAASESGLSADTGEVESDVGSGITVQDVTPGGILDYFNEVAIGSEYGESAEVICKWAKPLTYAVEGSATEEDLALIGTLCDRLNGIDGFPGIRRALIAGSADFVISFVPREEITNMFDVADDTCAGMAEYSWDSATGEIFSARAAIDESLTDERISTICEEFLQALGPACDSYLYISSVFYEGTSFVSRPSDLDWAIMEILYSPSIPAGMPREKAIAAAAELVEW